MSKHGNNRGEGNGSANVGHAPPNPDRCLYKLPAGIQHVRIERTTEDNERDAKQEGHQKRQANLAYTLNWITAGAAVLSFIALIFLYRSTQAATSQAQTAQSEFNSSQRPWVSADMQSGLLHFQKDSIEIEATGTFTNVGHSVALKVVHSIVLVPFEQWNGYECDWTDNERSFYEKTKADVGSVIFPGQPLHDVPGSSKGAMNARLAKEIDGKTTALQLISCVTISLPSIKSPITREVFIH